MPNLRTSNSPLSLQLNQTVEQPKSELIPKRFIATTRTWQGPYRLQTLWDIPRTDDSSPNDKDSVLPI